MTPYDTATVERRAPAVLQDGRGRMTEYLRVSVTDRCDLRCIYCMPKAMTFLPRAEVLSLEELDRICSLFIDLGVKKLRLTGGEPLVRKGVLDLIRGLSRHLRSGRLQELTLTTNGIRLAGFAEDLAAAGIKRVNVSLDTLKPETFARLTRGGRLGDVLNGLKAARAAGLKVKLNAVALAKDNQDELASLMAFAHAEGHDIAFIETMPLGEIDEDRTDQFLSLHAVKDALSAVWSLTPISPPRFGGPARLYEVAETGGRVGFITPLSDNFCAACNRVRLTCTGVLHTCLGHDDGVDLRSPLREGADNGTVTQRILEALARKPERHDFAIGRGAPPTVHRHMSTTGG